MCPSHDLKTHALQNEKEASLCYVRQAIKHSFKKTKQKKNGLPFVILFSPQSVLMSQLAISQHISYNFFYYDFFLTALSAWISESGYNVILSALSALHPFTLQDMTKKNEPKQYHCVWEVLGLQVKHSKRFYHHSDEICYAQHWTSVTKYNNIPQGDTNPVFLKVWL